MSAPTADHDAAVALAALAGATPARLRGVLTGRSPADARDGLARRLIPADDLAAAGALEPERWLAEVAAAARRIDAADWGSRSRAAGIVTRWWGDDGYPDFLVEDRSPPGVLFALGDVGLLDAGPVGVGIVGTRRATGYGIDLATDIGRAVADLGAPVVSGLALGVDGAAHRGAFESGGAPPIGVVASGLDRPYPARHRRLWAEVAKAGLLVSETAVGERPEAWRFPSRNRIIAALSRAVVVVESHIRGGALITAEEAEARNRSVFSVPGPVRSAASAGTNWLLGFPWVAPLCDLDDIRDVLGRSGDVDTLQPDEMADVAPGAQAVLEALGWEPAAAETVVSRTGLSPAEVATALFCLKAAGVVDDRAGWWQRRTRR